MENKWIETLKELMQIPRIRARVAELNLTNDEALQALPILLEMSEEDENTKSIYLTSFERNEWGHIKKILVLSKEGEKKEYLNNILTQQYSFVDFEDDKKYEKLEDRRAVVEQFAQFLQNDQLEVVSRGFFIFGPHGVGKTMTLKRFARRLAEKGRKVGFVNTSTLVSLFQTIFSKIATDDIKHDIIDTLKKVDYLFVDDIGGEPISGWFRDDILFQILNDRSAKGRGTFFSSNYSYVQLAKIQAKTAKEKYPDNEKAQRLVTRIVNSTTPFELINKPRD